MKHAPGKAVLIALVCCLAFGLAYVSVHGVEGLSGVVGAEDSRAGTEL